VGYIPTVGADAVTALQVQAEAETLTPYVPRALLARLPSELDGLTEQVPCTMVFADVSGFTRLSERLARRGEEGAEQLVDAINTCFSALLAEAYGRGGSLVKFGGDAMLLFFYDQDHALRACAAAAEMRRRLREVGRIQTGESNVVLRMSVGIHTGPYDMFVVGGSHRELLIAGPAATTVVAMEGSAASGQILLSADTARLLPETAVGGAVGPGLVLARAPVAAGWVPPPGLPSPSEQIVAGCIPPAVRAHLLSGSAVPEHRTATIAFLQFGGLDEVLVRDGMASAAGRLDELVGLVQDACDRYDVCFLDSDIASDGGKIRLSAGAPREVGDDDERMLLALRHIVEGGPPFPLRAGVHRGPVFTGPVGPAYRRWYAVMGDTVNMAARIVARTPAGHVYATREVLRGAKTRFEQIPIEPFAVKGKSRPLQVWEVGEPVRGAADAAIRMELPLVGRERELEQLRSAIERARRGSGTVIELVGETGSGKSRLMAEAAKLADGMVRLRASCEVYTRDTPYHAWRDPLRTLLGVDGSDPDEAVLSRLRAEIESAAPDLLPWVSLIAIVLDIEVAPSVEVEQLAELSRAAKLHEVVLRFLGRALVVPTIVEIEQAHLMDAASVALFQALARELESSSWVVLVTRRDEPGGLVLPDGSHDRIALGPLPVDSVRALALATPEAARVPPHVLELAVQRSGGSPEFLLDLLAAAVAGDRDRLPDSIRAATMARIDALDPEDRDLVRRAAVLGLAFPERRLADVLGPDVPMPDDRCWERLSGVFAREPGGHVHFRQPALQEVAYSSLPFKLRRQLHGAVALSLEAEANGEREADAAVLANHFALAGDHGRAQRYAITAAKRATERFAHADAVRLYQRAIESGRLSRREGDQQLLADAWEQLGDALRCVGEPAAASRALTQARRLIRDDPLAHARLYLRHAEVAERSDAQNRAIRWLKRGLRVLDPLEDAEAVALRARMRALLGGIRNRQGRFEDSISACRQAIAEAESVGALSALAHASYALDWALVGSGRRAEATHSSRALEIYEQLGDPEREQVVLNNLGMFAYFDGRWDDAIALYRRAGLCGQRSGRPGDVAFTDCNVGEILSDQGRLDEAEESLTRARRVWSATGERTAAAFVDVLLARLAVRRGDSAEAVPRLEAAEAELRRLHVDAYADLAQALIAEAEALVGDPLRAIDVASRALESADGQQPLLRRAAGIALARLGLADAGRAELTSALADARERAADYDIAATLDALDSLGSADADMRRERDAILDRLKIVRLARWARATRLPTDRRSRGSGSS
jgi:class 3 adenylate cyclase/tetratricopeptide (TPR) repeat protein